MFKFSKETRSDTLNASDMWKNRLKAGLGALLITSGIAGQAHGETPVKRGMDRLSTISSILSPNQNFFSIDAENNEQDAEHLKAYRNTVFIVQYTKGIHIGGPASANNAGFTMEMGSGTVVNDSKDKNGHNVILTASHVIGYDVKKDKPGTSDPCSRNNVVCYAYDSSGNPLGRLHEAGHHSGMDRNVENFSDRIGSDVVALSINPIDERYDELEGMPLASRLPSQITKTFIDKKYKALSGDKKVIEEGLTPGGSGGGVYLNDNGRMALVGVVSYVMNTQIQKNGRLLYTPPTEDCATSNDENFHILDGVIINPEHKKVPEISDAALKFMKESTEGAFFMKPNFMFTPALGDATLLSSLGNAGKKAQIVQYVPGGVALDIIGYPNSVPTSFKGKVDDTPRFDKDLMAEMDGNQNGKFEKDIISKEMPNVKIGPAFF